MPLLTGVKIQFDTHNESKDDNTVVHVFIKNRLNNTQGSESNTDFISNYLDLQRYLDTGDRHDHTSSPYLAYKVGLAADQGFDEGSSHEFDLNLMPQPVSVEDIVLPVVNVHMLADGDNQWEFDYRVTFTFDDGRDFAFSSRDAGLAGALIDQDNRNFSGLCAENPLLPLPVPDRPLTKAFLRKVRLDFHTHNDEDRDHDTRLDVEIANRLGPDARTALAVGSDLFHDQAFEGGSVHTVVWPSPDGNLTLNPIDLADMVLPEVIINIATVGDDHWVFDYRLTMEFADRDDFQEKRVVYTSTTSGVVLSQDFRKHVGAYHGPAFPAVAARTAPPLSAVPVDRVTTPKRIPLSLVRAKLDEFINNRNGTVSDHNPPLRRIRIDNAGVFNDDAVPETYIDLRSIIAGRGTVNYVSSPASAGQFAFSSLAGVYVQDVNSSQLTLTMDNSAEPPVLTAFLAFETDGPEEVVGTIDQDFHEFSITLKLTLTRGTALDEAGNPRDVVDLLHWIDELDALQKTRTIDHIDPQTSLTFWRYQGTLLGRPVDVPPSPLSASDLFLDDLVHVHLVSDGGEVQHLLREIIQGAVIGKFTTKDAFTGRTGRDGLNSMATSWLLGGVPDDDRNDDGHNTVITDLHFEGDEMVIAYTGPQLTFVPPTPADWPGGWDLTPGTLANIKHLVVLTMENRSFDHMLGYLSLPAAQGGAGRSDVDGLKGMEFNDFRGTRYHVTPLSDTFFSPDPPHGFEPVHRAINDGQMDGFVREFAAQNGPNDAGKIMGYHTAQTVPTYDRLALDSAIGHRWFASHPGPTFANRFYELTGRLNLDPRGFWEYDNSSPLRPVFTDTIFDHLANVTDPVTGEPVTWMYFEHGYCFLRFFERHTFDNEHIAGIDEFFTRAHAGTLPSVTFVDPRFVELPPDSNCDGAPADVRDGQDLVESVVDAVVAGPQWDSTLLLVVYDEHGGFYDHVPPSPAARVSADLPVDTHGVRVPAFVISPWVPGGTVFGHDGPGPTPPGPHQRADLHFDHTSILKTIVRRFLGKLTPPPYLGARFAEANDLSAVVTNTKAPTQFRPFLRYTFQFGATQTNLGVKDGNPAPGTPVWLLAPDGSTAEQFSFEPASDGFFYIRSRVSNLYLSVPPPTGTVPPPPLLDRGVVMLEKFIPGVTGEATAAGEDLVIPFPGQARQHWSLSPITAPGVGPDMYLIRNREVAGHVLQPADPSQPGPVVLRTLSLGTPLIRKAWRVTNPLLAGQPGH
jgi:hypothetical protein